VDSAGMVLISGRTIRSLLNTIRNLRYADAYLLTSSSRMAKPIFSFRYPPPPLDLGKLLVPLNDLLWGRDKVRPPPCDLISVSLMLAGRRNRKRSCVDGSSESNRGVLIFGHFTDTWKIVFYFETRMQDFSFYQVWSGAHATAPPS
jgi:hypothetical protein